MLLLLGGDQGIVRIAAVQEWMKGIAMFTGSRVVKPKLLMLSHCVPSASERDNDRARGWQLLRTFERSHEVHLACLADGPVSLEHWRCLHARTKQIVIEPPRRWRQWLGRTIGSLSPVTGESIAMRGLFRQPIREWIARHEIESVLCTHPALLSATKIPNHCRRTVDLHDRQRTNDPRLAACDALIVSNAAAILTWSIVGRRTIVIPSSDSTHEAPSIRLTSDAELEPLTIPIPLQKAA